MELALSEHQAQVVQQGYELYTISTNSIQVLFLIEVPAVGILLSTPESLETTQNLISQPVQFWKLEQLTLFLLISNSTDHT
jgi:hypothetical protein